MLVLSRRANEEIVFPSLDISISVTHCTNKLVRLGITAPRHIRIVRGELEPRAQTAAKVCSTNSQSLFNSDHLTGEVTEQLYEQDLQDQIDTIKLAVQLAQTQLDHQREQRCQDALKYALEAIAKLETSLATPPKENKWVRTESAAESVHEVSCGYRVAT